MKHFIILVVLMLLDVTLTYKTVTAFETKFPDKDAKALEMNPITRTFWKVMGYKLGSLFSFIFSIGIIILVFNLIFNPNDYEKMYYFLYGAFLITNLVHLKNLIDLGGLG